MPGMIDTHRHMADRHARLAAARRAVEHTVAHLRSALGEEAWHQGMNPPSCSGRPGAAAQVIAATT
jgi:hypothetical protein